MPSREQSRVIHQEEFLSFFSSLLDYQLTEQPFQYISSHQKISLLHLSCGTKFQTTISKFWKEGTRCPNSACFQEKRVSHLRKSDRFFEMFTAGKYKLLEKDFQYKNKKQQVKIKHVKCGTEFSPNIDSFVRGLSKCPKCKYIHCKPNTVFKKNEYFKKEILAFINNFDFYFEDNGGNFIFPEKNLKIVCDDLIPNEKRLLFEESKAARENGMRFFHIFSDEWKEKSETIKSMIGNSFGINKRIFARNCEVGESSAKEVSDFFRKTHISGGCQSAVTFVLRHAGEIVCAMSLRKPIKKKYGEACIEIARFSSKLDTTVVGGFGRLLAQAKLWAKERGYTSILSYSDLRFGSGNVYRVNGFEFVGTTTINYWYTDGNRRFSRQKFRASNGKTEQEIAKKARVSKIYGCGHYIFKMNLLP
jgi:hypothetical protein